MLVTPGFIEQKQELGHVVWVADLGNVMMRSENLSRMVFGPTLELQTVKHDAQRGMSRRDPQLSPGFVHSI